MALSYGQVEHVLAKMNGIPPDRMMAFRARLKHFKRLNFPPGVNTGSGRRVQYGARAILHILIAFEMLQLGLTPERAIQLTQQAELSSLMGEGSLKAAQLLAEGRNPASPDGSVGDYDPASVFLITFDPAAITANYTRYDEAILSMDGQTLDRFEMVPGGRRLSLINLTNSILTFASHLRAEFGVPFEDFGILLLDWLVDWEPTNANRERARK